VTIASTASCTPGTSSMETIFSASAARTTYGLASVLLPWWAATVHSPSSYARVTVMAAGTLGLLGRALRPARFAGRGRSSATGAGSGTAGLLVGASAGALRVGAIFAVSLPAVSLPAVSLPVDGGAGAAAAAGPAVRAGAGGLDPLARRL